MKVPRPAGEQRRPCRHPATATMMCSKDVKKFVITETNNLINAASIYVARELGLKQTTQKESRMPLWQRRIEGDIKRIRKDINMLERVKRGELRKREKMEQLEKKHNIWRKGVFTVLEANVF